MMTMRRGPWADRNASDTEDTGARGSRGQAKSQSEEESTERSGGRIVGVAGGDRMTAVLIGFPRGLEDALSVVLAAHYTVVRTPSAARAIELLRERRVELLIASSRCPITSVVKLTEALGRPRKARVIVLLAGRDPEAERLYREAGLRYVLHMPVKVEDLMRVSGSLPETHS
jgi:hypothetical protein